MRNGEFAQTYTWLQRARFSGETNSLGNILGKYRVHGKNNVEGARSGLGDVRRRVHRDSILHRDLSRLSPAKIRTLRGMDWPVSPTLANAHHLAP